MLAFVTDGPGRSCHGPPGPIGSQDKAVCYASKLVLDTTGSFCAAHTIECLNLNTMRFRRASHGIEVSQV